MVRDSDLQVRLLKHRKCIDEVDRIGWLKNEPAAEWRRPRVIPSLHMFRTMIERCTAARRVPNVSSDFEPIVLKHGISHPT